MTADELYGAVDAYLSSHLDASYWSGLDESARSGAVAMAEFDILAELPGISLDGIGAGSFACMAIAEQAVYLARNYENLSEGRIVTSESVGDVSEGYTVVSDNLGLSFRAAAFIKRAKSELTGGSIRIARG
ncbi:MAG: hypothetical protein LUE27_07165 [Clostridia bacterium]|nr:hypothetical protein [Clostridia bacterium]